MIENVYFIGHFDIKVDSFDLYGISVAITFDPHLKYVCMTEVHYRKFS